MGLHARIEPGGSVAIDTAAWLDLRTAGTLDDLTTDLLTYATRHHDDGQPVPAGDAAPVYRDWCALTESWLRHRDADRPDPDIITHQFTRLDAEICLHRATTDSCRIAVVSIDNDPPVVHCDSTNDSWDWFDTDSVIIHCPNRHGWTWGTGRELLTTDGDYTTLTVVFGPDIDAPFSPCPECTAHRAGHRDTPCDCDRTPWIICPTCSARCDVDLATY